MICKECNGEGVVLSPYSDDYVCDWCDGRGKVAPWRYDGAFVCWLLGHRYHAFLTRTICTWCGVDWSHEDRSAPHLLVRLDKWAWLLSYRVQRYVRRQRIFRRCPVCGRPEIVLGRRVGDHESCPPF